MAIRGARYCYSRYNRLSDIAGLSCVNRDILFPGYPQAAPAIGSYSHKPAGSVAEVTGSRRLRGNLNSRSIVYNMTSPPTGGGFTRAEQHVALCHMAANGG